ncbi:MAG: Ppx/GppA family phosphatase [Polyangiaceae bacterium]|jgi:exopolyphosphatase/guanosine-5'-triphosphate,3'-diphosphate pyrophosphatase|nr:Ppx/GppA family phosphatase [Polyangiaceae bacterium]
MRVASVDIGTNSVLLLVAERGPGGEARAVLERATITRLGEGVDATGELSAQARERTLRCLESYAREAREAGVEVLHAVGTSAMRDARGGAAFAAQAEALLGAAPRVISGQEEARLTFRGALSGLATEGPVLVFDVGGGSTELIVGQQGPSGLLLDRAVSLDVGSVRLTERYLRGDPPTRPELEALEAEVARQLDGFPVGPGVTPVGVAGTVTTLAAVARGVVPYDAGRIHGLTLDATEVEALARRLASLPVAVRRGLPGLEPKRADVIAAGALLVAAIVKRVGAPGLVVSDRGVRWGLALELLDRDYEKK